MTIERLFVLWADRDGRRHVVGHLCRAAGTFAFWYDASLPAAEAQGFVRLAAFDEVRDEARPYEARYLFATFAERIPVKARPDLAELLQEWGVEHADDQFEILAKSGGVSATDRLELAEYRCADDDLRVPLELRVAGSRHQPTIAVHPGAPVMLEREPGNSIDACATLVLADTRERIGYVPRQYSQLFAGLLDRGTTLRAEAVRRLTLPEDAPRWVIRARRAD